jgi:serine/threonine-protein kinase
MLTPGSRFGSYAIGHLLGAGGMGEVFRARDTNLKREVALKVLPAAFVADTDRLARFRREAELLAALNHPNIAQVYGLEHADGQTAIVMELVEGPTLADRLARGRIPPDEALAIALQIVAALEAAHARQIVHRDLKPANVKIRDDGTVKVLDFGISKPIDPATISGGTPVATTPAMTQTGVILGTAAYMSPEQARGKFVDERTDIWAFGCVLFEMLTGQPAFGDEDVMLTLAHVLDRDTDFSSIPKTISPAVRHTVRLCLQKDPRKRIADIRDVRLALEGRFESELADVAGAVRARRGWRRALLPTGALALGAALMALVGVALWPEAPPPRLSRQIHAFSAELRPALENNPPILAVAPDGSEFAYASNAGLVRRVLSELEGHVIPGTAGVTPIAPHYSVDGKFIVYGAGTASQAEELRRIPIGGGTPVQLLADIPDFGWWPAKDGGWLASLRPDACRVVYLSPGGADPEPIFEDPMIRCVQPQLLPDGEHLLIQSQPVTSAQREGWSIAVRSLVTHGTPLTFPGQVPTIVDGRFLVYFEPTRGLLARPFNPATLEYGDPVLFVHDVRRMTGGQGIHGRVSANGTLVYMRDASTSEPRQVLARVGPGGQLEGLDLATGALGQPTYSPDASRLALQRGIPGEEQIWVIDLSGGSEPRQLTREGRSLFPSWSADSLSLVYTSDRGGKIGIWRQRADGRSPAEAVTVPAEGMVHLQPLFAPDGRLVYTELNADSGLSETMIVSLPNGEPEPLIGAQGPPGGTDFSRDGRAIAYHSSGEIYVEPWPRDGSTPLRVSNGTGARAPVWSRTASRLAFESGPRQVTVVDIDTERLVVTRPPRTFDVPFASRQTLQLERRVAAIPDSDDWLVIIESTPAAGAGDEFVIVENWIRELEARVPSL